MEKKPVKQLVKLQKKGTTEVVSLAISEVGTWGVSTLVPVIFGIQPHFRLTLPLHDRIFSKLLQTIFHLLVLNHRSLPSVVAS